MVKIETRKGRVTSQHRRSAITGPQLQARLDAMHVSQRQFARMIGVPPESVNRSCNAQASLPISMAIGLRYVEMMHDIESLLDAKHDRLRRRLRVVLRKAQAPITAPVKRRHRPRRRKLPEVPPIVPQAPVFPPSPPGFYYAWQGHTMILVPHKPQHRDII
jgi:plasmid maintenance system antidote protein VapI